MRKALVLWGVILLLAMLNGGLREAVLLPVLPRAGAFVLSGLILIACIASVAVVGVRWIGVLSSARYAALGAFWLGLTLGFEFAFGLLRGASLATLLQAYRFKDGNLWPVVLLVVAVAPWVAARSTGRLRRSDARDP